MNTQKQPKKIGMIRLALYFVAALIIFSGVLSYRYVMVRRTEVNDEVVIDMTGKDTIEIEIPLGSGTEQIATILKESGLIKYPMLFRIRSRIDGYDGKYKSGKHVLRDNLAYHEIMSILTTSPQSYVKVFIPEGLMHDQIVKILENSNLIDRERFNYVAQNMNLKYEFLKDIPDREKPLEGYLFPDTYYFDLNGGEEGVINTMLLNFNNKFEAKYYERAKELGMTIDELITLASIIEKEAQVPSERKYISSVFHNRLNNPTHTGGKLQSCATVQYIFLRDTGEIKETIYIRDTQIDDSYNTYMYAGLPPGPIASPGKASIEAAFYPAETNYYFFVARGDGSHAFSRNLSEHNANIVRYGVN